VALESVVEEARSMAGISSKTSISWNTAIERGLLIDADPDQLFRVLLNLMRNAVQALESRVSSDEARIRSASRGRRLGGTVVIEVADTGPGLPPRARAHLFEPFQGAAGTYELSSR
jgi:signal transduction histidine kinase